MATAAVDRALLDTNVLLAATDQNRPEHARALAVLNDWSAAGTVLYTSGQILREYVAVATRPASQNGLGMRLADALSNVRTLRERLRFLEEREKTCDRLLELADAVGVVGKHVHDANIVATVLTHGIGTIVTMNVGDFARYRDDIEVVSL